MQITERLSRKIHEDFKDEAEQVIALLEETRAAMRSGQSDERVTAAAVIVARGDTSRFLSALELMQKDWRDLLEDAGLAEEGWEHRLDEYLTP